MTLLEQRCKFGKLLPRLLDYAMQLGYEVMPGEILRSQAKAEENAANGIGSAKSLHIIGLAIDLTLVKDGNVITDGEGHGGLGVYWLSLDPDCRWGGTFKDLKDYGHYSLTWEGRA